MTGASQRFFCGLYDAANICLISIRKKMCPILLVCFFFFHEIISRCKGKLEHQRFDVLSSLIKSYHYLLFHLNIPSANTYQAAMSDALLSTKQSKCHRHGNLHTSVRPVPVTKVCALSVVSIRNTGHLEHRNHKATKSK